MFSITATDPAIGHTNDPTENSAARTGTLDTSHANVETPVFMPVTTMGTVKMLPPSQMKEMGL